MTQDKTISRDEFIYGLKACGCTVKDGQTYYEENELIKCFGDLYFSKGGEKLPPVNPQPNEDVMYMEYMRGFNKGKASRPTGRWIEDTNGTYTDNHDTWECSECGHAQILLEGTPKDNDYNYCPSCGAKMIKPQAESEDKE